MLPWRRSDVLVFLTRGGGSSTPRSRYTRSDSDRSKRARDASEPRRRNRFLGEVWVNERGYRLLRPLTPRRLWLRGPALTDIESSDVRGRSSFSDCGAQYHLPANRSLKFRVEVKPGTAARLGPRCSP